MLHILGTSFCRGESNHKKTDERKTFFVGENVPKNKELIVFGSSGVFYVSGRPFFREVDLYFFVDAALFSVWI